MNSNSNTKRIEFLHNKNSDNFSQLLLLRRSVHQKKTSTYTAFDRNPLKQHSVKFFLNGVLSSRTISTTNVICNNASEAINPTVEGDRSEQQTIVDSLEAKNIPQGATNNSEIKNNPEEISGQKIKDNNESIKTESSDDTSVSGTDVEVDKSNELVLDFLPEKPLPVDGGVSSLLQGMDPPLESLGLASWWPSGRMQYFMEFLHSTSGLDLPWWQAIICSKSYVLLLL